MSYGLGGIVRDKFGKILASFCSKLNEVHNPFIVEALALIKAMLTSDELDLKSLCFEGDY